MSLLRTPCIGIDSQRSARASDIIGDVIDVRAPVHPATRSRSCTDLMEPPHNMVSSSDVRSSIQKARVSEVVKERALQQLKDADGGAAVEAANVPSTDRVHNCVWYTYDRTTRAH